MAYYNPTNNEEDRYYDPYNNANQSSSPVTAIASMAKSMIGYGILSSAASAVAGFVSKGIGKRIQNITSKSGTQFARNLSKVKSPGVASVIKSMTPAKQVYDKAVKAYRPYKEALAKRTTHLKQLKETDWLRANKETFTSVFKDRKTFAGTAGSLIYKHGLQGSAMFYGIDTMLGSTDHLGLEKKPIWDVPGHVMNYAKYMKSEAPSFMAWGAIGGTFKGIQGSIGMGMRGFFDKNQKFKDSVIGGLSALTRPYYGERKNIFSKEVHAFRSAIEKKFLTKSITNIKAAWGTGTTQLLDNSMGYFKEAGRHVSKAVGNRDAVGGIKTRANSLVERIISDTKEIWKHKRETALMSKTRGLAEIPGMAVLESFENLGSMEFHANKPQNKHVVGGGGTNLVEALVRHNEQIKPKSFIASVLGLKPTKAGDVVNTKHINQISSSMSRYFPDGNSEPLKQAIAGAYMGKHFYKNSKFHVDLSYFSPVHTFKRVVNKLGGMNFNLLVGIPPVGRNISLGGIITSDTFLSDNISATTFRKSTTGLGLITGSDQITHETGTGVKRHKNPLKNLKELIRDAYGDDGISRDSFGVTYIGNKFYAVDGTNISPLNTKETILKYSHPSIFGMAGEGKTSNLRRWQYHNNKEIEQAGNLNLYKHYYDMGEPRNQFLNFMKNKLDWTPPQYATSMFKKFKNILKPGRVHTNGKRMDHSQELVATAAEGIFGKDLRKDGLHEHVQSLYHLYGHSTQEVSTLLKSPTVFNALAERSSGALKGDASIMHSDSTFLDILSHNKRLLGDTIDPKNIFYELTQSPELKTIYNTAINYPNKAKEHIIFQRHGRLSKLSSMDLIKTRYVSSMVDRGGGPEAFVNASEYLFEKNLISKNQAKAIKTHGYLTTLFRDGRLANQSVVAWDQKGIDLTKEIVGKYKDQHNVWLQDIIDYTSDTDMRVPTFKFNKSELITGATHNAFKLGSEFQNLHDSSPFTAISLDPHGQMRYKSYVARVGDIASERLTNLINDLTGLKKNPFKYGDGFKGSMKYLTTRMGQTAGAVLAYRTLDTVIAANPAFDQTMFDAGITGFVSDEIAKTHLLSSKVGGYIGITKTAQHLEGLMPGFTSSAPGALIGGALNWRKGALATVGGAFRGAIANRIVSPLMPDMTKTYEQLQSEYSGESQVPIIDNKMWFLGSTPWQGTSAKGWQPNWYVRAKSRWQASDTLYGSEIRALMHKPIFPIGISIGDFVDPYYNERHSYHSRPYLETGDWGKEIPLGIGPIIAGTIGRLIKPKKMMHREFFDGPQTDNNEISAIRPPSYREGRGMMATSVFNPKKYSALSSNQGNLIYPGGKNYGQNLADNALDDFESAYGLITFGMHTIREGLAPRPLVVPTIETAGRIASQSRGYYDMALGGLGLFSEGARRFVNKPDWRKYGINPIPNLMPQWVGEKFKCISHDTLVEIDGHNFISAIDLKCGDIIRTHTGKLTTVSKIIPRNMNFNEKLYEIAIGGFRNLKYKLSEEHPCMTPTGWKKIEDISIGDFVGYPIPNISTLLSKNTIVDISEYINNEKFTVTSNWIYPRKSETYILMEYMETNNILKWEKGECKKTCNKIGISWYKGIGSDARISMLLFKSNKPSYKRIKRNLNIDSKEWAIIQGYYLAEGSASGKNVVFSFHEKETSFHNEVKLNMKILFDVNTHIYTYTYKGKGVNICACNSILSMFFRNYFGKDCKSKKMTLTKNNWKDTIRTFINGDGFYYGQKDKRHRCSIKQPYNIELLYNIWQILLTNNIVGSIGIDNIEYKGYQAEALADLISLDKAKGLQKFNHIRKVSNNGHWYIENNYFYTKLRVKNSINQEKLIGISINGDNSFCLPGLATHNTGDPYSKILKGELRLPGKAYNLTHSDVKQSMPGRSSMFGSPVEHQVQYFAGLLPPVLQDEYDIMGQGTAYHEDIQNWLSAEGMLIQAEALVYDVKNDVSGHVDAVIRDGQGGKGRRALEIKTISDDGILKLKGPKNAHVSQLNFYLNQLKLKKGSILYVNRDNPSDFRLYEINYNHDRYTKDLEKLQKSRMVASQMLAKGIEGDSYGYSYSWLDRMAILSDVNPNSPEYKESKFIVQKQIKAGLLTQKEIEKFHRVQKQRQAVIRKYEMYPSRFRGKIMSPDTQVNIQSLNENIKAAKEYGLAERVIGSAWEEFTNTNTFLVNKFFAFKDPIEHYKQFQLYGKEYTPWTDPYGSFIEPGTKRAFAQTDPIRGAITWGLGPAYFIGGKAAAIYGGIAGGMYGAAHGLVRKTTGTADIPENIDRERDVNNYFDELKYYKNQRMAQLTVGLESKKYINQSRATITGILQGEGQYADLFRSAQQREKPYIDAWLRESDPMRREEILRFAPEKLGEGLKTFWNKSDSEDGTTDYVNNTSAVMAGSKPIKKYNSQEIDPNIFLEDIKLKTINNEGMSAHDFGLGWQEQMIRVQNNLDNIQGSDINQTSVYPEITDVSAVKSALYSLFNRMGIRNTVRVYANNHVDDDNTVNITVKRDRLIEMQNALNNRQRFM